jgi:hypothetical protein
VDSVKLVIDNEDNILCYLPLSTTYHHHTLKIIIKKIGSTLFR